MITPRSLFTTMAMFLALFTIILPTAIVSANASTLGRLVMTNTAAGDPAILKGMSACIGNTWTGFEGFEPGKTISKDLAPGTYSVKIIRVVGAMGPEICTMNTAGNNSIIFEQNVEIKANTITEIKVTGTNVTRFPLPAIIYKQLPQRVVLGNNRIGIWYDSAIGDNTSPLTLAMKLCVNGKLVAPINRMEQEMNGIRRGYIDVFPAVSPISTISYGYSNMTEDTNCVLPKLYPTIYPRIVNVTNTTVGNNYTDDQFVFEIDDVSPPFQYSNVVGLNINVTPNAGLIDAVVTPTPDPTPTPTNNDPATGTGTTTTNPGTSTTTTINTTPAAAVNSSTSTTTATKSTTSAPATASAVKASPALVRTGGEDASLGLTMVIGGLLLLMFNSATFDAYDENKKPKKLKTSANLNS